MSNLRKFLIVPSVVFVSACFCGAAGIGISPTSWAPGILASTGSYLLKYTVSNSGNEILNVNTECAGSGSWSIQAAAGGDQFRLEYDATGDSSYQNMTTAYQTDSSNPNLMNNVRVSGSFTLYLRLTPPTSSSSKSTQTMNIDVQGITDDYWTYNTGGNFYWRDAGVAGIAPSSDWSSSTSSILASTRWQYMTGTTNGWQTFAASPPTQPSGTFASAWVDNFLRTNAAKTSVTGTCPFTHSALFTMSVSGVTANWAHLLTTRRVSWASAYLGTVMNSNSGTSYTYGTRQVNIATNSRGSVSEFQKAGKYSYTYCSVCGYANNSASGYTAVDGSVASASWDSTVITAGSPYSQIITLD